MDPNKVNSDMFSKQEELNNINLEYNKQNLHYLTDNEHKKIKYNSLNFCLNKCNSMKIHDNPLLKKNCYNSCIRVKHEVSKIILDVFFENLPKVIENINIEDVNYEKDI